MSITRTLGRTPRRSRRGTRRPAFDALESRLAPAIPNEITALYGGGFTPTSLHLNGSATLADAAGGTRLRLTDGGPDEIASAYDASPVDVSREFTTSFSFQFTPIGDAPLGEGFTFEIQDDLGPETIAGATPDYSTLGVRPPSLSFTGSPQVAVKFDTTDDDTAGWAGEESSDNSTGLYVGALPSYADPTEIPIPKADASGMPLIDFHSGHTFRATLHYTPPAGADAGRLDEAIDDLVTGEGWAHIYPNVDLSAAFRRADVSGKYAYAGFTATTGAPTNFYQYGLARGTQDILGWTWHDGAEGSALPYSATFSLDAAQMTAGAVYDANGGLIRTLWQADRLPAGTYVVPWDGLDQHGDPPDPSTNPGPYTFRVIEDRATYTANILANDVSDPADPSSFLSATGMMGIAVDPTGGTIYAGSDSFGGRDTAGGSYVKALDGTGAVDGPITAQLGALASGQAFAIDSGYLYAAVSDGDGEGIIRARRSDGAVLGFADFTDPMHANPDGSHAARAWPQGYGMLLVNGDTAPDWSLRGIAVSDYLDPLHGSVWVTDLAGEVVHRYDKATGEQIGTPIPVAHPTGIAIDDETGDLWIAHGSSPSGPADLISLYDANGNRLRDITEAPGLSDVWSLCLAGGKLYVADNGAGHVLVYTLDALRAGLADAAGPQVVGRPASYGHDDGADDFWDLRGVAADAAGDIYTVQETASYTPSSPGSQLAEWSPAGQVLWVKGGYEYQSNGGAWTMEDPDLLISPSLHRYELDRADGTWRYVGSAAYPGYDTNRWSGNDSDAPLTPPRSVRIGGSDFYTLSWRDPHGNRLIFFRVEADGSLHPATIVGADGTDGLADGDPWTWSDSLGDGTPRDAQVEDFGDPASLAFRAGVGGLQVDSRGDIWFTAGGNLDELPLQGLDAAGDPLYDWSTAVEVIADIPGSTFVVGTDGIYLSDIDAGLGPESAESVVADFSIGGDNALRKYDLAGGQLWEIPLPCYTEDIDAIPGGGVVVGSMVGSVIYRITADGQVVGEASPVPYALHGAGDWLDYRGGAVSVGRDPRDGILDVFSEGLGSSSVPWFRIDDRTADVILGGTAVEGRSVPLAAAGMASIAAPTLVGSDDTGIRGDGMTSVRAPHLSGMAPAGSLVQIIVAESVLGAGTAAGDGSYSVAFAAPLADGTYGVTVRAIDASGDLLAASGAMTLVIDTTPPATPSAPALLGADDSGVAGDGITDARQPRLAGTADPGATVQILDVAGEIVGSDAVAADGTYTVQFAAPLADGTYAVRVRAVDASGNASSPSPGLTLTIDTTAPAAPTPALSPADDTGALGDGMTVVRQPHLVGKTVPGDSVDLLDANGNVLGTATAAAGDGSVSIPLPANLGGGVIPLRFRVRDVAGNVGAPGPTFDLDIVTGTADLDGDGKSDIGVFRPSTAQWLVAGSAGGFIASTYGATGLFDIPVPADYDGVGHSELAVSRPSTGQWIIQGPAGIRVVSFGATGLFDIPVPGDYDGVGHAEIAVFRPSTAQWIILTRGGGRSVSFGATNLFDDPLEGPVGSLKRLGWAGGIRIAAQSEPALVASPSRSAAFMVAADPVIAPAPTETPTPTPAPAPGGRRPATPVPSPSRRPVADMIRVKAIEQVGAGLSVLAGRQAKVRPGDRDRGRPRRFTGRGD